LYDSSAPTSNILAVRVYFSPTASWGQDEAQVFKISNPKAKGFFYVIEMSATADFSSG